MKNSLSFSFFALVLFASAVAFGQPRTFGVGGLVLDDSLGHTITIETPKPGDPGYAAWVDSGGVSVWKLPIPPFANANAGFVLPGNTAGQLLVWVPPPAGGPQGAWEPADGDTLGFGGDGKGDGGGGGLSGSGSDSTIAIWTGPTSLGNSSLTENGTTLNYSSLYVNTGSAYQIGSSTVLSDTGAGNTFIGIGAAFSGALGNSGTALGNNAILGDGGSNRTAIGANADVEEDNAIVLGSISGDNGSENNTSVGIGTNSPNDVLDVEGPSDLIYLSNYGESESPSLDIRGDYWSANTYGQLVTGGYDHPVNNTSLTLDDNTHLGTIGGFGTSFSSSSDSIATRSQFGCGATDVAGLLDFTIVYPNQGSYAKVNFSNYYSGYQTVTITAANPLSAENLSSFFVAVPDGNSFELVEDGNLPPAGEYQFYYHVIDVGCQEGATKRGHTTSTPK